MTRCIKCHRPLKHATESGLGPVCAKASPPAPPAVDRDLFGYDTAGAAVAARHRLLIHICTLAMDAHLAVKANARAAAQRMRVPA